MDNWSKCYSHEGKNYVLDTYSGKTYTYEAWVAMQEEGAAEFQKYVDELNKSPERVERRRKQAIADAKRNARVDAQRAIKAELEEKARIRSKTLGKITNEMLDQWRIDNGYLWRVTSPTGKVYSEVLKKVTPANPNEYIEFTAMKIAHEQQREEEFDIYFNSMKNDNN